MSRLRTRVGLLLGACALIVVVAGPVQAQAKIVVGKASKPMPAEQGPTVSVTAHCPAGTRALSGGWDARGAVIGIFESIRASDTSWRISAVRYTNDLSPLMVKAYVYCDKVAAPSSHSVNFNTTTDPNATVGHAVCPEGKAAISAGFSALNFELGVSGSYIAGAMRTAPGRISVTAFDSDDASSEVDATAYCKRVGKTQRRKAQATFAESGRALKTPECGRSARAGGFSLTTDDDQLSVVDRFQRIGSRWVAHAYNSDSVSQTLRLQAYCP